MDQQNQYQDQEEDQEEEQKQVYKQQNEDTFLHTIEDISQEFDTLQLIVLDYEETLNEDKMTYDEAIKKLLIIQQSIIQHSLFSPNESITEVATENMKYLLLPYYIGETFCRISKDRRKNLNYSHIYLNEFLKLCDHYEIVSKQLKQHWKSLNEDRKYEMKREDKIQSFKDKKTLENKLKNLNQIKEESDQRIVLLTQLEICIIKSIDSLKTMNSEFDILDYKEKMEKDKEFKQEQEKILSKPIPKISTIHIPKLDQPPMFLQHSQEHDALCKSCVGKTAEEIKMMKRQEVWQPGISMPSVTLDQLADMFIDQAQKDEKKKKIMEEEQKYQEEVDSDKDEKIIDQKTLKDRAWDDWKDENEKGAGNKMK